MSFSIVIPVADRDLQMIHRTLRSWLALGSDDVILCVDKPASEPLFNEIERTSRSSRAGRVVRTLEVEQSSSWKFQQAHARRAGFEEAAHETILTGDIDLIIRREVLKVVDRVGNGSVGLVSCLRLPAPLSLPQLLRAEAYAFKQKLFPPAFSGLYAFWRPDWRATEDEGIRRLRSPAAGTNRVAGLGIVGEDTYLFICMRRRYQCVCLNLVGALGLSRNVEDLPSEQYSWGRYLAGKGSGIHTVVPGSIAFAYPYLLMGYLHQRRKDGEFRDPFGTDFRLPGSLEPEEPRQQDTKDGTLTKAFS